MHETELDQATCGVPVHEHAAPKDIVLGLHWAPPRDTADAAPADLDALCVLLDESGVVVDLIHPDSPRAAGDAVVHTGDSRDGSSPWDDERIFVFLDALPPRVHAAVFVVRNAGGYGYEQPRGAIGHVSDRETEGELLRVDLPRLPGHAMCAVATIERTPDGWSVLPGGKGIESAALERLWVKRRSVKGLLARPPRAV